MALMSRRPPLHLPQPNRPGRAEVRLGNKGSVGTTTRSVWEMVWL